MEQRGDLCGDGHTASAAAVFILVVALVLVSELAHVSKGRGGATVWPHRLRKDAYRLKTHRRNCVLRYSHKFRLQNAGSRA